MSMMEQSTESEVAAAILRMAKSLGCSLSPRAIGTLVGPARRHFSAHPSDYPIDDARLNRQLADIFERLRQYKGSLTGETFDEADLAAVLPKVACHYLWFC
jgi:hypothetical protein